LNNAPSLCSSPDSTAGGLRASMAIIKEPIMQAAEIVLQILATLIVGGIGAF